MIILTRKEQAAQWTPIGTLCEAIGNHKALSLFSSTTWCVAVPVAIKGKARLTFHFKLPGKIPDDIIAFRDQFRMLVRLGRQRSQAFPDLKKYLPVDRTWQSTLIDKSILRCFFMRKKWTDICLKGKSHSRFRRFRNAQSPQKPWKISLSYSFAVEMGHFDVVRWKYDSVCIFSMLRDTLELILWKKTEKKCKDQQRSIVFAKGALIGKNIFQIQQIDAVRGRCSISGVLGHIPSNFTHSVGRPIVL